ncbi:hypothetical protein PS838_05986 [Pseudomonas fluorescens]|nr:hypothetical protein PS838_05986 [Pseudomonas fluorescens]
MALKDFSDIVTIVISPGLTLLAAAIGWIIIIKDSRSSARRAEATELINLVVDTTVSLNRRAANFLLEDQEHRSNHRAWVSSVSVDIASLRARASILKNIYRIEIPDTFFYTLRRAFTLNAEDFHRYDSNQISQQIQIQTSHVSKSLASLYILYPSQMTWRARFSSSPSAVKNNKIQTASRKTFSSSVINN